jgi:hypothetical protein
VLARPRSRRERAASRARRVGSWIPDPGLRLASLPTLPFWSPSRAQAC